MKFKTLETETLQRTVLNFCQQQSQLSIGCCLPAKHSVTHFAPVSDDVTLLEQVLASVDAIYCVTVGVGRARGLIRPPAGAASCLATSTSFGVLLSKRCFEYFLCNRRKFLCGE